MGILSQDSDGIHFGGIHIPDISNIFKHHPTRPSPAGGSTGQHPLPPKSFLDYAKYMAAGGLCATITHVSHPHKLSLNS